MKVLNFGSLNIDFVYQVENFVKAGETIDSFRLDRNVGGKGLNQSIALSRAGAEVWHAGCIGEDGTFLRDYLAEDGVGTECIAVSDVPTGHAIIQVDRSGQNCILLYGGANRAITRDQVDATLARFAPGDIVLLQNEISELGYIITAAHDRGLRVYLNPSPITEELLTLPLDKVDCFILNETEGESISGAPSTDVDAVMSALSARFPAAEFVLTLGSDGAVWFAADLTSRGESAPISVPAEKVVPVDTTAAGDTFTGYYISSIISGLSRRDAMLRANHAAAISVTTAGAARSIPRV